MPGVGSVRWGSWPPQPASSIFLLLIVTGGVVYAGADDGTRSQRALRSNNCSNRAPATTASQTKVKVVVKPIPKPDGKESTHLLSANEIAGKGENVDGGNGYVPDTGTEPADEPCHDPGPDVSVTTTDDSDRWKTKVIIGCTVAAAVEIIIIIVIIAYWREIRWTMRKIACPCDERPSRRGDHEAMERADLGVVRVAAPERRDLLIGHTEEDVEDGEVDGPMQTFRHPSRSRTQEALDDVTDDTTPV